MELNCSGPPVNLSGSEQDEDVYGWRLEPIPLMMALVMASLYGAVALKVYRKNRHDLEPLHIFELNTLANISGFCLIRAEWSTSMSRSGPRNCLRQLSYAIKNQLGHPKPLEGALERKIPPLGGILLAPRWFFMA